ncbi:lysylphosphatidylglycerol synthase transmembrane domain-containing protein [Paracoccus sp. 1_MG-2023]|uniref:lysylphosphatidylglycerol synthase transmembrane domain-containing protein n=1 Tax=unclassified Paracoccus (in: a-proteobacteria) TaxID=2688777 RepID=UPI001C09ADD3|nr:MULTISPECIES: lysylphosphatidylglycerol synthase transmembrane domain-containing protein [unclassified Paracoccus (in: a-proteobacteria)]MBU2956559.1 flippase-like domain-containing protein [Paracoccus sp. C2R09]MDO6668665.1 lysylphosphatidylglycerol synthase transmembrane domain-containing protein [Paracoccus sp. 1_MG-2023]
MNVRRSLQFIAALCILSLLWWGLDGRQAVGLLAAADPRWLVAALAALTAQTLLSALRWQITARALGQGIPLGRAVSEYYLAQIVNQSLPGGVVGDAGRALRARGDGGLRRAGAAVAIERGLGQVALLAILLTALALPHDLRLPQGLRMAIEGAALLAALAALVAMRTARDAIHAAVTSARMLPLQIGLNIGIAALNIAGFAFAAHATGTGLAPAEAAIVVPLILLTMILPVTVAGWGLREGAAAAMFPLIGATPEAGLAASLCFGLVFLTATLPGIAVILRAETVALTRTRT